MDQGVRVSRSAFANRYMQKMVGCKEVEEFTVTPEDAGLSRHPLESCGSGKPEENAGVLRKLIAGELQVPLPTRPFSRLLRK